MECSCKTLLGARWQGRPNMGGYVAHGFWLAGLFYLLANLVWGW